MGEAPRPAAVSLSQLHLQHLQTPALLPRVSPLGRSHPARYAGGGAEGLSPLTLK